MNASGAYFFLLGAGVASAGEGAEAAAGDSEIMGCIGAGGCCLVEARGLGAEVVDLRAVVVVVGLLAGGLVVEEESLTGGTLEVDRIAREVRPSALLV